MPLNPELIHILACPLCRGPIQPVDNETGLECPACNLVYPVQDDIPIMLQEKAICKEDWDRGQCHARSAQRR